jgi:predicted dehydrogenase
MEAQKSVFLPLTLKAKEIIQSGAIGDVVWAQSVTAYPGIDHVTWFRDIDAGGGTVHFMSPYPLEYLQFLLDETITNIHGVAEVPQGESDAQSNLSVKFGDTFLANIFLTTHVGLQKFIRIQGTKGNIYVPDFWKAKEMTVTLADGTTEKYTDDFKNEFTYEAAHVNAMILTGKKESTSMKKEITLATVRAMEQLYKEFLM